MIAWKIWHDTRHRFYGSIFFLLAIAVLHVASFPFLKGIFRLSEIDLSQLPDVRTMLENFVNYTNLHWFQEIERNALFGVILALGGILTEARHRTILLTLSLPVRRRMWLLFQFGIVLLFLLALNLLALPVLIAGGYIFNQPMGFAPALLGAFMLTLTGAPYVGMTILFTSISGDNLRACLYSFAFLIFSNKLDYFAAVDPWMPESFMTVFTQPGFPWQALITILAVSAVSLATAITRFEKTDY
ncbi:hypothetical protein L0222_24575 [bacterium]|nr:hypothetical protein [bacterium]